MNRAACFKLPARASEPGCGPAAWPRTRPGRRCASMPGRLCFDRGAHARADRHLQRRTVRREFKRLDFPADAFGHSPGVVGAAVEQHHHEFIAADAGEQVFAADAATHGFREPLQHLVTDLVSMQVVDGLEWSRSSAITASPSSAGIGSTCARSSLCRPRRLRAPVNGSYRALRRRDSPARKLVSINMQKLSRNRSRGPG